MKYFELTKEEEKLLESFDKGAFVPVKNVGRLKSIYKKYAENTTLSPSPTKPSLLQFFINLSLIPPNKQEREANFGSIINQIQNGKIHNDRG